MALLGKRKFTAGDTRRFVVDYKDWLERGETVATAAVTSDITDAVVSAVTASGCKVVFFLAGGTVNEIVTVAVAMTSSLGEIKHDTIEFNIVAP